MLLQLVATIDEIEDFLKFGKLVFSNTAQNHFADTDYMLQALNLYGIEPYLLPRKESIHRYYSSNAILTYSKNNNFPYLLNMCVKVTLDYIFIILKECSKINNLEYVRSLATVVLECTEIFEREKSYFCNDFSTYILSFTESLFVLLDTNYSKNLSREGVSYLLNFIANIYSTNNGF